MIEPSSGKPTRNVRIAPELYDLYAKVAERKGRSITAQINWTLRRYITVELARSNPDKQTKHEKL